VKKINDNGNDDKKCDSLHLSFLFQEIMNR
jgi:hypothetical protein